MVERVYLSRRNLMTLLSKLDRAKNGQSTNRTITKNDNVHPRYPQSMRSIEVVALEDDDYYTDRDPGDVLEKDLRP